MIRNQWYVILESGEVKTTKPVGVTRLGQKLVLWRDAQNKVHCMGDKCPHMSAPLHRGKIIGNHIACPFHGFEYDASGACALLPALGKNIEPPKVLKADVYPAHESNGFIWIYWGEPGEDLQPPVFFESLEEQGFSHISFQDAWNVHYSRMAENQLDVCHLPFVHHNTIGRGGRKIVEGPVVQFDGQRMNIWVYNREDDGTPPQRVEDLPPLRPYPYLQFQFPNLWHNWIADDVRVMIAFVPVDEEHTILYGRFYQRFMKIPLLRGLVNLAGKYSSRAIASQDKRVVTRQVPKKTAYKMGERLRPSDAAIVAYRRRRKELKELAGQEEEVYLQERGV
jgi:phenylpropionate dioxygenase-like ring-hydroxylating dioxygenase large terminal subunit